MAEKSAGYEKVNVEFVGLKAGQEAPEVALYETDALGRPCKKLAKVKDGQLNVDPKWQALRGVALGPDTDDPDDLARLDARHVIAYRLDTILPVWRERGLSFSPDLTAHLLLQKICVDGRVRKCGPWWWSHLQLADTTVQARLAPAVALAPELQRTDLQIALPSHCVPLCDGIVEIYERVCCCRHFHVPDILDRLRDIFEVIPIPLPDPPFPPGPGPDPPPFEVGSFDRRSPARLNPAGGTRLEHGGLGLAGPDAARAPSERLYADYVALSRLSGRAAEEFVLARRYLIGLICTCTQRKVGEVPLQPGGRFDFCYTVPLTLKLFGTECTRSFAFRVRQRIQGSWVTVYDGLAAQDWFDEGETVDLHTSDWRALPCGDGPGDPPLSEDGLPFVILEYIGSQGTHHFNFPTQVAVSQVAALASSSGTYATGYAPDCPWGGSLGLRLWVHPDMEPMAEYYRFSVVPVSNGGSPSGAPTILDDTVAWKRWVLVGGDWVTTSETLSENPANVGGQQGLVRIPYWSGGNYWLSSQYHQRWNTTLFPEDKYMLVVELFDASGGRIKPSSAPAADPGTAQSFQLRRWRFGDPSATDNVPFADAAHVFWTNNTVVKGDIVDFRKNGVASTAECQFISGPGSTTISVGFRAYHPEGVSDPTNTFMRSYNLTWRRGLNGPGGSFASGTADVGEPPAGAHPSNTLTIGQLLGPWPPHYLQAHQKCTFSVRLHVEAKHFTGSSRILSYDYHESASFALSEE